MSTAVPVAGMKHAMQAFPEAELMVQRGQHTLWRVSAEYVTLVGPALTSEDTSWCLEWLPRDLSAWAYVPETYGDVTVHHFMQMP